MLSVFITPCTKPTSIHRAISDAWAVTTASNSARYGFSASAAARVVPRDGVVGEAPHQLDVARGRRRIENCPPADGCSPPARAPLPAAASPGGPGARGDNGERPGRGDAQRVHRLADDVFAQHRADRGQAIAAARERRRSRTLEVNVTNGVPPESRFRRAAARVRHRAAGRTRRTGGRRRPAPPAWHRRAPGCPPGTSTLSALCSQAASMPKSAANRSLSTSNRGSGGTSACQRTAISGSSRENRSSRTTAASGAMLTSPRLRMPTVTLTLNRCDGS